ncbi:hypothetical protein P3T23_003359 [Paraburkholderia sp. GAS448]
MYQEALLQGRAGTTPVSQNQLIACQPFEDGCESVQIGTH